MSIIKGISDLFHPQIQVEKESNSTHNIIEQAVFSIPIKSDSEIESFWSRQRAELHSNNFWADEIKKLKDEPAKRLDKAIENFPLPAAFREATVALRSIIKALRKAQQNYEKELSMLYRIAAIDSFMSATQYIEEILEPAFNVIEIIPKEILESLSYKYKILGYNCLPLLNKSDCKWIVELWGQPDEHTTLRALHQNLWDKYCECLIDKRWKEENKFLKELGMESISLESYLESKREFKERLEKEKA